MRVLIDATGVSEYHGGMKTYLLGLLHGWRDYDDELTLAGMSYLPSEVEGYLRSGSVRRLESDTTLRRLRFQQLELPGVVQASKADVVLSSDPSMSLRARVPTVVTVHDLRYLSRPAEFSFGRRWYRRLAWGQGMRRAAAIIAVSNSTRDEIVRAVPSAAGRVQVVHHGGDHVRKWRQEPNPAPYAIAFAHWTNKRPEMSLHVWQELRRMLPGLETRLKVIGVPAEERDHLSGLVSELGLDGLVELMPHLPNEEYEGIFSSAALVLMPSTLEGFGLPVLEALALGIPIVASGGAGMEEAGGACALYAQTGMVEEFAQLCATALFDGDFVAGFQAQAAAHAEKFTWSETARRTREVLWHAIAH